jgi:hypothetical protein
MRDADVSMVENSAVALYSMDYRIMTRKNYLGKTT